MFDHVSIGVSDLKRAGKFYDAVMKPLDSLNAIQITQDRGLLREAIESFSGRKGDYAQRTPFERNFMSRAPAQADQRQARRCHPAFLRRREHHVQVPFVDAHVNAGYRADRVDDDEHIRPAGANASGDGLQVVGHPGGSLVVG